MALTWEDQKMNVITAGVVLVVAGMLAYHLHLFGMGEAAPAKASGTTSAAFASAPAAPSQAASSGTGLPMAPASYGGTGSQAPGPTVEPPMAVTTAQAQPSTGVTQSIQHLQGDVSELKDDLAILSASIGKVQQKQIAADRAMTVRLQALAAQKTDIAAQAPATRQEIAGYRLQSIAENQAWLTNPDGQTVIARPGAHLPGLSILSIAPYGVRTSAGWLGF